MFPLGLHSVLDLATFYVSFRLRDFQLHSLVTLRYMFHVYLLPFLYVSLVCTMFHYFTFSDSVSSRYFSRSFVACFLNLVTHTFVQSFHYLPAILVFHLAFDLWLARTFKTWWLYPSFYSYSSITLFHSMKWGPDRFLRDFWWLYTN